MALVFAKVTYPSNHWSLQRCTAKNPNYVADFAYKVGSSISHYNVKMNPTDSRGYRAIVSLTADDLSSTFNRAYRDHEIDGLMLTLGATSRSMSFLGGSCKWKWPEIILMFSIRRPVSLHWERHRSPQCFMVTSFFVEILRVV